MEAETEPKEELATEELKKIKAQEETEILRKLQVNITFAEVLEKKSPHMAYLKTAISDKMALKGDETVILTKKCSTLVQKKVPPKMPDPGSFLIPCTIWTITFEKALCDIGSNTNLKPLFVMKKLGNQGVHSTRISLEMVDKSLKLAYGMVENVLVKVEDLYLPADFMILDTREDKDNSIILGRPFLAIPKALIDVEKGEMILRVWEDHILFKIPNPHSLLDKRGTKKKVPKG
ncbi:uncharacterized protein LOC107465552 [Arachis duranensis]|uniref:Uncharacterized protein LOC107465552 n=1 Tax=Arachis duranensis TaxID=130453 RepID=A0A6P4C5H2_ARADU|nr:uncharacterized protein LOC107465552 [Arachis duranensis]